MAKHEVTKGTSAMEMQWYEQFRKSQEHGISLVKTRTFVGRNGEICETKLPITEHTVFVGNDVLAKRAQQAQTREREENLARAQRGLETRDRNTTLPKTEDMKMVAALAGDTIDIKI